MPRETLLARTLVELADTLVADFDVVELLALLTDRCLDVLDVGAAGIMLVAPEGDLRVMASSSETMRVLELFELQSQEGPCLDCYRTGKPVGEHDLSTESTPWRHMLTPTWLTASPQPNSPPTVTLPMRSAVEQSSPGVRSW